MAFVKTDYWEVDQKAAAATRGAAPLTAGGNRPGRLLALAVTAAVHALLLWMLVTHLRGPDLASAAPGGEPAGSLTTFNVANAGPAPAASEDAIPPNPVEPVETELETTSDTPLPPPEWRLVRLPPEPARTEQGVAARGPASSGSGGGGESVYDPFAGAAPMRRDPAAPFELDSAALRALVAAVRRERPRARGTIELEAQVSPAGTVLDIRIVGGSAPVPDQAAVRRALLGQRIFSLPPGAAAGSVRLPLIEL